MPHKLHMTYRPVRKGWVKKYQGTLYWVSCKQLGVPPTKEQSWQAANEWWEKKQQELDAREKQTPPHPRTGEIIQAMQDNLGVTFTSGDHASQTFRELMLTAMNSGQHLPDWLTHAVLGPQKVQRITEGVQALIGGQSVHTDRTIGKQVENWLTILRLNVSQQLITVGRYDAYARHVRIFERWVGGSSPVEAITAPKLEDWWAYLALKVSEQRYSPAYARVIFMTTRQFIRRLGEQGIIPLPGNIASKRFRFGDGPKQVDRLTIEEARKLLEGCDGFSERTKLYVLLMLNCGMYQSDISDLGDDEVDWKQGTITRPRSKTPNGPKVKYRLWSETLDLLKQHRAKAKVPNDRGGNRVLLTDEDKPLVCYWMEEGKQRRYDIIQSAFTRLWEKIGLKKPIKLLRKTSASELAAHPVYGAYTQYFLAHSPKGVTDRFYVKPDDGQFFEALEWLRGRYLGDRLGQCPLNRPSPLEPPG